MSERSLSAAALRGAVDLSSLGQPRPVPGAGSGSSYAGGPGSVLGVRVDVTDANIEDLLETTTSVPALAVIWSSAHPDTKPALDVAMSAAAAFPGRLRVLSIDIQQARMVAQAFQVQQVPVTLGLIAAQPVPLYGGIQTLDAITPVLTQLLDVAAQNGVKGTFDYEAALAASGGAGGAGGVGGAAPVEPEWPPLHQAAFDAIERGDLDAAATAYESALKENPGDEQAKLGLAQVGLLQRTTGVDHIAARRAAADAPTDVDANLLVADLDVLGGHVADAFARLIDLVRVTADEDRQRVRRHLLELFEVVGAADERVVKARRALMSALF